MNETSPVRRNAATEPPDCSLCPEDDRCELNYAPAALRID